MPPPTYLPEDVSAYWAFRDQIAFRAVNHLHNGKDEESAKSDQFDEREPKLGLTKCLNTKELECKESELERDTIIKQFATKAII